MDGYARQAIEYLYGPSNPYGLPYTPCVMKGEDFCKLPFHPTQRKVEPRVEKTTKAGAHLSEPSSDHLDVVVVLNPETGVDHKLDGHTRGHLWMHHPDLLPMPEWVLVRHYKPATIKDFVEFYRHFDNIGTTDTTPDLLSGMVSYLEWDDKLQTQHLAKAKFSTGFLYAHGGYSLRQDYDAYLLNLRSWADEVFLLDRVGIDLRKGLRGSAAMAAILLSFHKYGEAVLPFWQAVANVKGLEMDNPKANKSKGEAKAKIPDTVRLVEELVGIHGKRHLTGNGRGEAEHLMCLILAVVERHMRYHTRGTVWCKRDPGKLTPQNLTPKQQARIAADIARGIDPRDFHRQALNEYREEGDWAKARRQAAITPTLTVVQ